jgi:hypothetical protein
MIFQPRSLQQRTLFFILTPTLLLLVILSVGGFLFVRNILLGQWGETAVVKLQRTAHLIDMQLRRPKELLFLLQSAGDTDVNRQIFTPILRQVEELEGVVGVNVEWPKEDFPKETMNGLPTWPDQNNQFTNSIVRSGKEYFTLPNWPQI